MERHRGLASAFHARPWPDEIVRPSVWLLEVTRPALVLGSTQADGVVDGERARASGLEVVQRQSGGGAVLLRPAEVVWVDVLVPAGDPLWEVDVSRAFHWLGRTWVEALADVGVEARSYEGPTVATRWSSLVCFAALGSGEVTTGGPHQAKVVGISQRRRRTGALLQCAALLVWDPGALLGALRLPDDDRRSASEQLATAAAGLGVDGGQLEDAFLERLARR